MSWLFGSASIPRNDVGDEISVDPVDDAAWQLESASQGDGLAGSPSEEFLDWASRGECHAELLLEGRFFCS